MAIMLAATRYYARHRGVLGAINEVLTNPREPVLSPDIGVGPKRGYTFVPPSGWTGGTSNGGSAPTTTYNPPAVKAYWFTAAVGPTAGGQSPGTSQPPGLTTPADTAVNTVTGGGNSLTPTTALPPAAGGSNTPVATEPTATVVPTVMASARRWWPWAVAGLVVAGIGAYAISR